MAFCVPLKESGLCPCFWQGALRRVWVPGAANPNLSRSFFLATGPTVHALQMAKVLHLYFLLSGANSTQVTLEFQLHLLSSGSTLLHLGPLLHPGNSPRTASRGSLGGPPCWALLGQHLPGVILPSSWYLGHYGFTYFARFVAVFFRQEANSLLWLHLGSK